MSELKYTIKTGSGIPEGRHTGEIVEIEPVERGEQKYKYLDIIMRIDDEHSIKYSCPEPKQGNLNPKSKIGELVNVFTDLEENSQVDLEELLIGKKISFMTADNDNGFSKIVEGSFKTVPQD